MTGLIIPTRYHSERLPGKVLMELNGVPNLKRIIDRALSHNFVDVVVLAISEDDGKEILNFWRDNYHDNKRVLIYSGEHNNLIGRTLEAAQFWSIDTIIDISHCCTFFDPFAAKYLITVMKEYNADYVSNCITRSFPDGFDIQVYTREIYEKINSIIPVNDPTRQWTGWNI